MSKTFYREAAEREADEIGLQFANSNDVIADMSQVYGVDFSKINIHTDSSADAKVHAAGKDGLAVGRDVFFGKGIFEGKDPASKGFVAHELAHTMQQGIVGDTQGVHELAPTGTEQGGIISYFKNLLKPKQKTQYLGGQKATDEASLNYMAAMKAREKELFDEKRVKAKDGLFPLENKRANTEWLEQSTDILTREDGNVDKSNKAWDEKGGKEINPILRFSSALQELQHRESGSEIGKVYGKIIKNIFSGSQENYIKYMEGLDEQGTDFSSILQKTEEYRPSEKTFRTNEEIGKISSDIMSIFGNYATSEAGLEFIGRTKKDLSGVKAFQETGVSPMSYIMQTMMTNEGIRSQVGMVNSKNYTQEGQQAKDRIRVITEANRNLMVPMLMDKMSQEERDQIPQSIQALYVQYQGIIQKIEEELEKQNQ